MQADQITRTASAALLRINLTYLWRHGRLPNLSAPSRFTELIQLRKLYEHNPRMPLMADKVGVKSLVAERLGLEWVVPMLWSGTKLPSESLWTDPIIVKSRHGCRQNLVVRAGGISWRAVERATERWVQSAYGGWLDEWLYAHVPRGLLIEPFIGAGLDLPIDYKIYVFHGEATYVQVHLDRAKRHRWIIHDTDWRVVSGSKEQIAKPSSLNTMLAAAEELAKGFSFVRVDFYQPERHPLFGEITFYPGSGLDPFDTTSLDETMGKIWLNPKFGVPEAAGPPNLTLAA